MWHIQVYIITERLHIRVSQMAKDKTLSIKIPIGLYERMIREVDLGEYTNVSDLTKVAIRMHLLQLQQTRVRPEENDRRTHG